MRKTFEIFADYHQILLKAYAELLAPVTLTPEDCRHRILVAPGVVTLMPERNMDVFVSVELTSIAPPEAFDVFDHVAEASLDLSSGCLVVDDLHGTTCCEIEVAPGIHRVRFAGRGFATLSQDRLDGEDRYEVTLWPAPYAPVHVLKQYEPA